MPIRRAAYGEGSPQFAQVLVGQGRLAEQRGRIDRAAELYGVAWEVYRARLGDEHLFTQGARADVERLRETTGRR